MSHFTISAIDEDSWPQILRIQAEVYVDLEPESLDTLRSKWQNSPQCCSQGVTEQGICAYLLAHAWHSDSPPKLYQPAPAVPQGDVLFIHDLAVSKGAAGRGIGMKMVNQLLDSVYARAYRKVLLVAVQDSTPFWQKCGFRSHHDCLPNPRYGRNAIVMQRHTG